MSDLLVRDAAALHRALATSGDEVNVALSRETAVESERPRRREALEDLAALQDELGLTG